MRRALSGLVGVLVVALGLALPGAAAARNSIPAKSTAAANRALRNQEVQLKPVSEMNTAAPRGRLTSVAKRFLAQGYLVPDQATYDRAKGSVNGSSGRGSIASASTPLTPATTEGWEGIFDTNVTPSDSVGAVGPTRYIELINQTFAIYTRAGKVLSSGRLSSLVGSSACGVDDNDNPVYCITDPQIIWDSGSNRFYYVALDFSNFVGAGLRNFLAIGFSKTSSPNASSDWCKYGLSFGTLLPDYPKLGDTRDFLMFGSNTFDASGAPVGSDLTWITKPPVGSSCPAPATF